MTALHILRYMMVSVLFLNLVACGSSSDSDSSSNDPTVDIDSGLIAYYPFNGNANDESGNSNITEIFGATLTADRNSNDNSAYLFDGQDDSMRISVDIRPTTLPKVTMTAWVRANSNDSARQIFAHDTFSTFGPPACCRKFGINFMGSGFAWSAFAGDVTFVGNAPVTIDEWVFVAVSYDQDAQTVSVSVNGNPFVTGNTRVIGEGFDAMLIGANPPGIDFFFGAIDEVRIYDRTLNDNEINAIFTLK